MFNVSLPEVVSLGVELCVIGLDSTCAVFGPLMGPQTVRHVPHLDVRPEGGQLLQDGLHLPVAVVPGAVAEVGGYLSVPGGPQTMDTPPGSVCRK